MEKLQKFLKIEKKVTRILTDFEFYFWQSTRFLILQNYLYQFDNNKNNRLRSIYSNISLKRFFLIFKSFVQILSLVFKGCNYERVFLINERTLEYSSDGYYDPDFSNFYNNRTLVVVIPDPDAATPKDNLVYSNCLRLDFLIMLEMVLEFFSKLITVKSKFKSIKILKVVKMYQNKHLVFRLRRNFYKLFFFKVKPIDVYLKSSYSSLQKCFIIGAKERLGINIVELQHSFIYEDHPGYVLPYSKDCALPNKIIVGDNFSLKNLVKMGWPDDAIVYQGRKKSNPRQDGKTSSGGENVLIISQITVLADLVECINNIDNRFHISVKLHPREYQAQYEYFRDKIKRGGVKILPKDCDIDICILNSDIVIGSYSTALYEAMNLGKRVIVINKRGLDVFSEFVNNKKMEFITLSNIKVKI